MTRIFRHVAVAGFWVGLATMSTAAAASLSVSSQSLTPYRTCTLTATPSTSTIHAEATVRQASPTTNYGSGTTTNVATGNGLNRRLYIRFDLTACAPAIPSTATIRLATLRLYASGLSSSCRTVDLFRVTSSWSESTITWNNQPFGATINSPASTGASDAFAIGNPASCTNTAAGYVVGADPTADVAAFVAGTATNYGWMLRDDVEGHNPGYTSTFSARNLGTAGQAPQLVITYVIVP